MTPAIILTPAAEIDIADSIAWYESVRLGLSLDFRLMLDVTLCRIIHQPEAYPLIARGLRRALLRRFAHGIFYRRQESVIQVVGILHTSRDPRIWQDRNH
jgi:toxin ParE1/3/4